ncbi:MAG: hypothetical protein AB7P14_07465 [Blastocatellales bacterium]
MPALTLAICGCPVLISASSPRLIRLFADYFSYYNPQHFSATVQHSSSAEKLSALKIELKMCDLLPRRETIIPADAQLFSQTGVVSLWSDKKTEGNARRFYFHLGTAAFLVDVGSGEAVGLVTPQAMQYPHILANTYALFALLLMLRSRCLYHLHAAAIVSPEDELWLICGAQRAGKTTLTAALGLAGWRPVSDDSLLVGNDENSAWLTPLKKYFHISDALLSLWPSLDGITRHHQYLDRTCVGGLEFFRTLDLAETKFRKIDHIVLPQIVDEQTSRIEALSPGQALLRLAEQSMFFQLWRDHTANQWQWLNELAAKSRCHSFFSATDLMNDPQTAARVLSKLP